MSGVTLLLLQYAYMAREGKALPVYKEWKSVDDEVRGRTDRQVLQFQINFTYPPKMNSRTWEKNLIWRL